MSTVRKPENRIGGVVRREDFLQNSLVEMK